MASILMEVVDITEGSRFHLLSYDLSIFYKSLYVLLWAWIIILAEIQLNFSLVTLLALEVEGGVEIIRKCDSITLYDWIEPNQAASHQNKAGKQEGEKNDSSWPTMSQSNIGLPCARDVYFHGRNWLSFQLNEIFFFSWSSVTSSNQTLIESIVLEAVLWFQNNDMVFL